MAVLVRMPKMSDTMTEGVVVKWHKKVGDAVKSGELLAEIETDKATMEFESYEAGVFFLFFFQQRLKIFSCFSHYRQHTINRCSFSFWKKKRKKKSKIKQ